MLNGTGSDRDAGVVFSSANGLLDPDFVQLNENEKLGGSPDDNPSAWMYHTYWGSQTTHASAGMLSSTPNSGTQNLSLSQIHICG
jgi:hypothetical protein